MTIDARLQEVLSRIKYVSPPVDAEAEADADTAFSSMAKSSEELVAEIAERLDSSVAEAENGLASLSQTYPEVAEAVKMRDAFRRRGELSMVSIQELVGQGRDQHGHTQRLIGGWLTAGGDTTAPVTSVSPSFTVSHWHWLAAKGYVRRMPNMLGPTLPYLGMSEGQIVHDLRAWSVFDDAGDITAEAADMFAAITGQAQITLFGTVLLYGLRRPTPQLPKQLVELNLSCAVRGVPRVTFVVGITDREAVSALVNNHVVTVQRRLRRASPTRDAAMEVRGLLDPTGQWPVFPMRSPVTITADVAKQLSADPATAPLLDTEPAADATDEVRVADAEKRKKISAGVQRIAKSAKVAPASAQVLSDIATDTVHAMAQICLRTSDIDVARGDPAALAISFLRNRGTVASYPTGNGAWRRITYVPADVDGIERGIGALHALYRGASDANR